MTKHTLSIILYNHIIARIRRVCNKKMLRAFLFFFARSIRILMTAAQFFALPAVLFHIFDFVFLLASNINVTCHETVLYEGSLFAIIARIFARTHHGQNRFIFRCTEKTMARIAVHTDDSAVPFEPEYRFVLEFDDRTFFSLTSSHE